MSVPVRRRSALRAAATVVRPSVVAAVRHARGRSARASSKELRLLLSALSAAALAQPSDEPSDHERGQQESDDHAHADEHIGENDSGAVFRWSWRPQKVCINATVRSVERIASPVHASATPRRAAPPCVLPQSGCPDRRPGPRFRLPSVDRHPSSVGMGVPSSTLSCLPQSHYRELITRGSRACSPSSKPRSLDRR